MKFAIKDFFRKCGKIHRKLRHIHQQETFLKQCSLRLLLQTKCPNAKLLFTNTPLLSNYFCLSVFDHFVGLALKRLLE